MSRLFLTEIVGQNPLKKSAAAKRLATQQEAHQENGLSVITLESRPGETALQRLACGGSFNLNGTCDGKYCGQRSIYFS